MKNKKGFTLIELLAVIVILGIIMTIATTNVLKSIKQSKIKARYIAAKDITKIAEAYLATNNKNCVEVSELILNKYLNTDATNPADENAKNISTPDDMSSQYVCKSPEAKEQSSYDLNGNVYTFNGYCYSIDGECNTIYDYKRIVDNFDLIKTGDSLRVKTTVDNLGEGISYQKILVEKVGNYANSKINLNNINLSNYKKLVLDVVECNNARIDDERITSVYEFYIGEDGSKKVGVTTDTFDGYEFNAKYYNTTVYTNRYCLDKQINININLNDVSNSSEYNLYINVAHGQGKEISNEKGYSTWLYLKNLNLK